MSDTVPEGAGPQEPPEPTAEPGYDPAAPAPLDVDRTPTGNAEVDAQLERLGDADHLATDGHLEVYEDVHRGLRDTLTALDATFLELEQLDEGALMAIGGAMVFDPSADGPPPSVDVLRHRTEEGLLRMPRYSERLSSTRVGGLSWPQWEPLPLRQN